MKHYLRNPEGLCGPYAIYNASIWRTNSSRPINELIKKTRATETGTNALQMGQTLNQEFGIDKLHTSNPERIKYVLQYGYGVILGYKYDKDNGHWGFFFSENEEIYAVNCYPKENIVKNISEEEFNKKLKIHYIHMKTRSYLTHPQAWIIPKKD